MSNFVIFKKLQGTTFAINEKDLSLIEFLSDNIIHFPSIASSNKYELKKKIQPKEQVFFLRNIIKAIDDGFVDFTDDKLYDFSFENSHAKDAGGVNSKFIDSDLKAEYKKEFDFYYQKMLDLIIANNDLKFAEFMYKMSDFFAKVLSESEFNEMPFDLREKFYEYLTDKFCL